MTPDGLLFWSSNNTQEIEFVSEFVNRWNDKHFEQPVRFQPVPEGQSSEEVIMAAVVGKTTPDIYANMWQGLVEMYAKAGKLVPLDTLDGFEEFIRERSGERTLEEIRAGDGHIYQIPWKVNPIMMLYNKNHVKEMGFSQMPVRYSEYIKGGSNFSKDADGDGYTDQWIGFTEVRQIWFQRLFNFYALYLAASDGAPLVKDNKAAFNNEHAIGVFRFLQKLYKNNYFPKETFSSGNDRFLSGKLASKWSGPWEIAYAEKFKPEDLEYAITHMPVPDSHEGPVYTYADPKNMVIFNTCQNPQLAWDFVKKMIDSEGDLAFLNYTGQLPRRQNILQDSTFLEYFEKNPKVIPFAEQANYVYGTDNCDVLVEVLDIISQEYEACAIFNKRTPEEAIARAARSVDILLGNF